MLNTRLLTLSLGIFAAVTFLVCIAFGLVVPAEMRMTGMLEQMLPGFTWLTIGTFLLGLVESFLYGAYAGLGIGVIYNGLARRSAPRVA
ncbi:MAG: DUF5676 family membrane protein [Vicinamibacterales bacterium]